MHACPWDVQQRAALASAALRSAPSRAPAAARLCADLRPHWLASRAMRPDVNIGALRSAARQQPAGQVHTDLPMFSLQSIASLMSPISIEITQPRSQPHHSCHPEAERSLLATCAGDLRDSPVINTRAVVVESRKQLWHRRRSTVSLIIHRRMMSGLIG